MGSIQPRPFMDVLPKFLDLVISRGTGVDYVWETSGSKVQIPYWIFTSFQDLAIASFRFSLFSEHAEASYFYVS